METPTSPRSGEIENTAAEYFDWRPEGSSVLVRMNLDAIDSMARDATGGFPTGNEVEIGGLLLGHVEVGDHPVIRIEQCLNIPCGHRLAPRFILDEQDQAGLVSAAEQVLKTGEFSVVGLYRTHAREGLDLGISDLELISRYFTDPSDLMLLVKPEGRTALTARFFRRAPEGGAEPVGPAFPFGDGTRRLNTGSAKETQDSVAPIVEPRLDQSLPPRRLVPDFVPAAVEPARTPRPEPALLSAHTTRKRERSWLPLLAAICLVAGGAWFLIQPRLRLPAGGASIAASPAAVRPLGLYVDPAGDKWRVSWNPNATALQDARTVQLFVREGEDQNRVDLAPADLAAGIYQQFKPSGNDVTFRLEVTENSGHVTAESFRLMRTASPAAAPAIPSVPASQAPRPQSAVRMTEPRAIHKVPPVVPMSIKPRIKDAIPIDVRVHIDAEGRVTSATPVVKQTPGLHAYLAGKAVEAAKLWRFEPARENGKPVPGMETIHFVFEN